MKPKIHGMMFGMIFLVLGGLCEQLTFAENRIYQKTEDHSMPGIKLPVEIETRRWAGPGLKVDYPEVLDLPNQTAEIAINRCIWETLDLIVSGLGYYDNPMTTVNGSYEIKTNERGVLSLVLNIYGFSGGAHGLTILKGLTFEVDTGKTYELSDLFKPDSDYVDELSNLVELAIIERDVPLLGEFNGIRPDQDYYIADKALVLFFQLYELSPYVFGFPSFPISVYQIDNLVADESLLERMLENH